MLKGRLLIYLLIKNKAIELFITKRKVINHYIRFVLETFE
ncbi:hypothetical protein J573_3227 [Acinetobacter baumannii 1546444]|nr:hypothetical protein J573_3227 [Acinetobacter baumannii 1546444]